MLKNWVFVYIGNFIGGALVAAAVVYGHQLSLFGNGMAVSVISTAASKCAMPFGDALIKGIMCNFLVCIALEVAVYSVNLNSDVLCLSEVVLAGCHERVLDSIKQ